MLLSLKPDVQPQNLVEQRMTRRSILGLGDDLTEILEGRCCLNFALAETKHTNSLLQLPMIWVPTRIFVESHSPPRFATLFLFRRKDHFNMKPCFRGEIHPLTDGTDDASVPGCDRWRINVQAAHVLQECVSHGCMQLLCLNEGSPNITMGLRHGFWVPGSKGIEEHDEFEKPGVFFAAGIRGHFLLTH